MGDLLVAQVVARRNAATITMPGWNTMFSDNIAGENYQAILFWRQATGGDPNTVTQAGTCNQFMARITRFGNVDTTQPLETQPLPAGNWVYSDANNVDTGTQDITVANSMLVLATFAANNGNVTEDASFSELYDIDDNSGDDAGFSLNTRVETTTGTKGAFLNMALSSGTDPNHGVLFAVRPAPGVGNPTLTINRPGGGTTTGDILIASIAVTDENAAIVAPSGWTEIRNSIQTEGGGENLVTYWRVIADIGSEAASYTWSFSASHAGAVGGVAAFSGVDTGSPIADSGEQFQNGNTATTHTAPSVNASAGDMLVTAHSYTSSGTWTEPGTMTNAVDIFSAAAAGAGGVSLDLNYELLAATGATGTRTATASGNGDEGVSHALALKVAPNPVVVSIDRADADPAPPGSTVSWTVTFNQSVTGVGSGDFALVPGGGVSGASITGVSGSGTTWTVTATTGSGTGTGTLGLNLVDDDSIINGSSLPLGGAGAGNGNFTGQVYTVAIPTLSSVINTYYPGSTASVAAGATSITLGAAIGSTTPIAIGDTLLIMQMQDASLNATNTDAYGDGAGGDLVGRGTTGVGGSGLYEYAIAASNVPIGGGVLTLACGTTNAYTNAAAVAGSAGQKKYQVIRVPSYSSAILSSTLTASAWNGSAGGVLAFDVTGALTLGGATVSVNGLGFRGGAARASSSGSGANTDYRTPVTNLANGSKGEGIAGTPRYVFTAPSTSTDTGTDGYPNGSFARGAPGNAGGGATDRNPAANDQNPGGGGGANGGAGGIGGIGWCPTFVNTPPYWGCGIAGQVVAGINPNGSTGGFGGTAVTGLGATRLTLGGGGGAGTTNNSTGTLGALSTSGAAGGGIIMIRAGSMSGSATFNANGSDGDSTVGNDGSGGGGAGGAVLISAGSGMGGVTINVAGGKGGDNLVPALGWSSNPHGPGGGGGGGYALTSAATASCSAAAGANGVTYRQTNAFGAYGAMPGSSGSCVTGLTAAQIPGTVLGATGCGASIDHYELSLPSGGVTCLPVTATVTACADNSSPCTSAVTTISGETATLGTSAGALGSTTVTFDASGTASTTLSYPAAADGATATVTLSGETSAATNPRQCCPDGASCVAANSCSATFNTAGFVFSTAANGAVATIPAQVAGVSDATYYLRAVKTNTTTKACESALTGANTVNFAYECNDPTTCYAADLMSVNGGSATTIARNDNGSVSSYTPVSMTFDANGNAPFTFTYGDVGQVTLHVAKPAGGSLLSALTGQSNAFVVKPYDFEVLPCAASVVGACTAPDVPADPGLAGGGAVFAKAGEAFKATVTARAFGGATTPSFGAGSNNGTETVDLTRTRVAPVGAGAADGILGGTTAIPRSSFSNGVATVGDLNWSEVGVITLTATGSTFLGNALAATGTTGNIGRFYPDHFDTAVVLASGLPMPCPTGLTCPASNDLQDGFVYSGQAFSTQATAKNKAGSTTQNYDGTLGYARATTLTAWDALGSTTTQNPSGALTNNAITAATFSAGVATIATPVYTLASATTAPTDIYLRATDTDGASSLRTVPATSVEGGVKVASGRIRIANAHGSEVLPLPLTATVQYYNGSNWVTSLTDSVSSLTLAAGNYQRKTGAWTVTPPSGVEVTAGVLNYTLSSGGGTGSVDLTATAPAWLPGNTGRATFGAYKGNNEFIYLRERY